MPRFPTVIASSVIRSAHQGQSHGGVYVVDLENERCAQVIDWDDDTISWEGRGLDRGLRGIALYGGNICIAASDEIFVYNKSFEMVESHKNRYLKHCHETFLEGHSLFLTSTGFDSILEFDLLSKSFAKGYCLRGRELSLFDPNSRSGPEPADTLHINNVHCLSGDLYTTGNRPDGTAGYRQWRAVFLCDNSSGDPQRPAFQRRRSDKRYRRRSHIPFGSNGRNRRSI